MDHNITSQAQLREVYPQSHSLNYEKVLPRLLPLHERWLEEARFCLIATNGAEGPDISPRGDDGPVVHIQDDKTLWLPDWRGNNRIDTLSNIVDNPQVSLLFVHPGQSIVMRVKGTAQVTTSPAICGHFDKAGAVPRSVIVISIDQVFVHCGRAITRAALWSGNVQDGVPSIGQLLEEATKGDFDGADYDKGLQERYNHTLWQDM